MTSSSMLRVAVRNRGGSLLLILAVVLLMGLGLAITAQSTHSNGLHKEAVTTLAGEHALRLCERALADTLDELARMCSDPGHAHFSELRTRILEGGPHIDLTDLLPAPAGEPELEWQRRGQDETSSLGSGEILEFSAGVDGLTEFDDSRGPNGQLPADEGVGRLIVECASRVDLGGITCVRRLRHTHELRFGPIGPPHPFDQVGFYIGDLERLTRASEVNATRKKIHDKTDEARQVLDDLKKGGLSPEVESDLRSIHAGLTSDIRKASVPLPEEAAAVTALWKAGVIRLEELDLAKTLDSDRTGIEAGLARLKSEVGQVRSDGGRSVLTRVTGLIKTMNRAQMRLWSYQRHMRVWKRGDETYRQAIGTYEDRLSADHYRQRVMVDLTPESGVFRDWIQGRRALTGIVRLRSPGPVRLGGELRGNVVLVIDAPELVLEGLDARPAGDNLTIVCDRTQITVSGQVHVRLIVGEGATFEARPDCRVVGSLHLARGVRIQGLGGEVHGRPLFRIPGEPGTPETYMVAFSPHPVRQEADRE